MSNPSRIVLWFFAAAALVALGCSNAEQSKQQHFQRGQNLAAQGKYSEAILEYRNALKVDAMFGEAHQKLAEAYLQVGNPQQAAKEFVRAADVMPQRADVQTTVAAMMLAGQDFPSAKKYAQAALTANPKSVDAQIVLANALAGLKDQDGAIRELEASMQLAPDDSRPYTSLGSIKATQGKGQEAEAAYRKAVEIDPKSVGARLALAYYLWSEKRLPETEKVLVDALRLDDKNELGNRMLAMFYLTQGRLSDSETPLLRLVNAKDRAATLTLADLYVRSGRVPQARPLYESLKGQKQTYALAVARLASLDYAAKKQNEAYRAVDDALKTEPNNTELLTLKARWLVNDRRLDEALQLAQKAATGAPQSAVAQFVLGEVHQRRGEQEDALKGFNDAIGVNPRFTPAAVAAADIELARGHVDASLEHALAARRIDPQNGEARIAVVRALLAKRDISGATNDVKSLLTDFPRLPVVHVLAGHLMLLKENGGEAAREFDRALEIEPANLEALTGRVTTDVLLKQPAAARDRLNKTLAQYPNSPDLLLLAARLENTLRNPAAAEAHLRKVIDVDPGNLRAYSLLGTMYVQQNRLDEARQEFDNIVKRQPDAVGPRTMVGIILDAQNRHDESAKIYESIVSGTAPAPVAANNLAYILADRGDRLDYALQLAQTAKQKLPDNPQVSDTLGWVYYKKNLPALAIPAFETSVKHEPQNAVFHFHLGLAYAKAGQPSKAREALESALKLQPNFPGADLARTTLSGLKG